MWISLKFKILLNNSFLVRENYTWHWPINVQGTLMNDIHKAHFREFLSGPVVKIPLSLLRAQVWSLVRDLRPHKPHDLAKSINQSKNKVHFITISKAPRGGNSYLNWGQINFSSQSLSFSFLSFSPSQKFSMWWSPLFLYSETPTIQIKRPVRISSLLGLLAYNRPQVAVWNENTRTKVLVSVNI